jgi:hypothetical protein
MTLCWSWIIRSIQRASASMRSQARLRLTPITSRMITPCRAFDARPNLEPHPESLTEEAASSLGACVGLESESFSCMAGHSRSKNGVASLAYVPAIHVFLAGTP